MTLSNHAHAARENARHDSGRFGEQEHTTPELTLGAAGGAAVMWRGENDVMIASETNPWVQVDGEAVNLSELTGTIGLGDPDCECPDVAGVILAMDTDDGIQRCDACGRFDGDLDAAQHLAGVLSASTGRDHTVWFEPAPAEPYRFDGNYGNAEQVRPFMDDYLRVRDDILSRSRIAYNQMFKGQIPGLEGATDKDEDTAIYLLSTLHDLDVKDEQISSFRESGGEDVSDDDFTEGEVRRGTVVVHSFYMGGTGFTTHKNVRLRRNQYGTLEYVEKGKRNGHMIFGGKVMFRED